MDDDTARKAIVAYYLWPTADNLAVAWQAGSALTRRERCAGRLSSYPTADAATRDNLLRNRLPIAMAVALVGAAVSAVSLGVATDWLRVLLAIAGAAGFSYAWGCYLWSGHRIQRHMHGRK